MSLASAAPAYADSGPNSLEFIAGQMNVTRWGTYQDLNFNGANLRIWGTPDPDADLTMEVKFVSFPEQANQLARVTSRNTPTDWDPVNWENPDPFLLIHRYNRRPIMDGATAVIDGSVGTTDPNQQGTFYVTFTLPGFSPVVAAFASV